MSRGPPALQGSTRQKILTADDPPKLWAVIDENVIVRSFGSDEAKAEQLQRLIDTAHLDHVEVQILTVSQPTQLDWRKSSRSQGGSTGNCVEIAVIDEAQSA